MCHVTPYNNKLQVKLSNMFSRDHSVDAYMGHKSYSKHITKIDELNHSHTKRKLFTMVIQKTVTKPCLIFYINL